VPNSDFSADCSLRAAYDEVIEVTCNPGFVGSGSASCDSNGIFSFPECIPDWPDPSPCSYPEIMSANITTGSHQRITTKHGNFTSFLETNDYFGMGVTHADVDGDGTPELVVAAPYDDDGGSNFGALYVLFVNAEAMVQSFQKISQLSGGLTMTQTVVYFGAVMNDFYDVHDDGLAEILIGYPWDDTGGTDRGAVYIMTLTSTGMVHSFSKISHDSADGVNMTMALGNSDYFGSSVSMGGDINGDGFEDILVGAYYDDGLASNAGAVYLIFLDGDAAPISHSKVSGSRSWFTANLAGSDYFGSSVAGLGDMNHDGNQDFAVSAYGDDDGGSDAGAVYVIFLRKFEFYVKSHQKISATSGGLTADVGGGDWFGSSMNALGDVNHDGTPDILVGATYIDEAGSNTGAVLILFLDASGLCKSHQMISRDAGPFTSALQGFTYLGYRSSVSVVGDINGDSIDDWLLGSYTWAESEYAGSGAAVVVFGTGGDSCYLFSICTR